MDYWHWDGTAGVCGIVSLGIGLIAVGRRLHTSASSVSAVGLVRHERRC
jgi:hypothetical protein